MLTNKLNSWIQTRGSKSIGLQETSNFGESLIYWQKESKITQHFKEELGKDNSQSWEMMACDCSIHEAIYTL